MTRWGRAASCPRASTSDGSALSSTKSPAEDFQEATQSHDKCFRLVGTGLLRIESAVGTRLEVSFQDGSSRTLDVYEAFWGDLMTSLIRTRIRTRVLRGLELVVFWSFSGIWRGFFSRKVLTVSYVLGYLLFFAWYWSTLALFFTAVGHEPGESTGSVLYPLRQFLGQVGSMMGGWRVWVLSATFLGFFPADRFVDLADFSHRFLFG